MSKVHLIKDCRACIYRWSDLCVKAGTRIDIDTYKDFPDWCPLPDLPEKMLTWHDDEQDDYEMGWNACLDAITGEAEV